MVRKYSASIASVEVACSTVIRSPRGRKKLVSLSDVVPPVVALLMPVAPSATNCWHITSMERTMDATHGFCIGGYNINLSLEPGEAATFHFVANKAGVYPYYCTEFCSALHLEMVGYFRVKPAVH